MDSLIRERNGKEEIWYSEEYLRNQIELAYSAGIHRGIKVEFHAVTPLNTDAVNDLITEFKRKVEEEYQKAFANTEVWRIS
jgi:hypothetical protein